MLSNVEHPRHHDASERSHRFQHWVSVLNAGILAPLGHGRNSRHPHRISMAKTYILSFYISFKHLIKTNVFPVLLNVEYPRYHDASKHGHRSRHWVSVLGAGVWLLLGHCRSVRHLRRSSVANIHILRNASVENGQPAEPRSPS